VGGKPEAGFRGKIANNEVTKTQSRKEDDEADKELAAEGASLQRMASSLSVFVTLLLNPSIYENLEADNDPTGC
jgi:hypothetical protein